LEGELLDSLLEWNSGERREDKCVEDKSSLSGCRKINST
jgi:hypothetical protein